MMTSPTPVPPRPGHARRRQYRVLALVISGVVTVLLFGALVKSCESVAGGPVLSETAFREYLRHTQEAGEDAVRLLGIDPGSVIDHKEMADASCKDDLVTDADAVTRDQPSVTWVPDFASRAAYTAAVATLREKWSAQGWKVKDIPPPAQGEPGAGLPGVRAMNDRGIELSLRPDWYSGKPTLIADGGCVRHQGYLTDWE